MLETTKPSLIIFTGGGDLEANIRDNSEKAFLEYSISEKIPVFGVCRGFQLINQYLGGSTSQLPTHMNPPQKHSVLYTEDNKHLTIRVNSYHNNIITRDTLAEDLAPIATDKNGAIEAAYSKSLRFAGMMWHPERENYGFFNQCCERENFFQWALKMTEKK